MSVIYQVVTMVVLVNNITGIEIETSSRLEAMKYIKTHGQNYRMKIVNKHRAAYQ